PPYEMDCGGGLATPHRPARPETLPLHHRTLRNETKVCGQPLDSGSSRSMGYLIVFLGGGLGAALRHGVNLGAARLLGTAFPYGTLAVNVAGSLAMGLLAAWFAFRGDAAQHWRLFFATGVLGGFTTFSAFSLDVALLYERGAI